jgi:uncharacterized sulfatase
MSARTTLLLTTLLLLACPVWADQATRPDIVLFLADDLGWADCSAYGGKDVPMPNLDRVAAEGMTFTHAFVASPSCAPSRAALLTGLYPMRNGAMLNHSRPRPGVKLWPAYFKELGYEVAAIGKVAHYAHVTDYGFDRASHFKYHEDTCIEAAAAWLRARKPDKPLCLLVGTNWPHVPWPQQASLAPNAVAIAPNLFDTPVLRRARTRYLAAVANADRDLGLVFDTVRERLGKDALFVFTSDHGAQFPFGKWNGYDAGVRTPLIVSWPGRVRANSKSDALMTWLDLLPTCLEAAGGQPPPNLDGRSFLRVLRGETASHRDRVFLTHSGDGDMNRYPIRAVRTRDRKYIRNLNPDAEHHTHIDKGVAQDGRDYWESWLEKAKTDAAAAAVVHRYHRRPAEEVYDLRADPWELKNLAAEPAHAEELSVLRTALNDWMKDLGDEGLKTERSLPDPRGQRKEKK